MHNFADPRAIADSVSTAAALAIEATPIETWSAQLVHLLNNLTNHAACDPQEKAALVACLQQVRQHTERMLVNLSATGLDDFDTRENTLLDLRQAARAISAHHPSQWGGLVNFLLETLDASIAIADPDFEILLDTLIRDLVTRLRCKHW